MQAAFTLLLLLCCATARATDYYVSPSGDDANAGTAPQQAWKNLVPVNAKTFAPGDRILFEAGGRWTGQLKPQGSGAEGQPISLDKYGDGPLPRIEGEGEVEAALYLFNVEHWEVRNLEISNAGYEVKEGRRCGVFIHLNDFGEARHIILDGLHVRDVSGWGSHNSNSGDGIAWLNEGKTTPSRFNGLRIENCQIARPHLNGIWGWSQHWQRPSWHPSINVVIRNNLVEDAGMSGIVPVGCDGALVEHNCIVRPSRRGTGIGIWPWSCDNTIIQFNEVSGSDGTHDGQAFDSDWNCRNSVFQYNYSHDNKGGFMLVCTSGLKEENIGCQGTVVRYNISENDGGTAKQVIFIAGPCNDTYIYNNTIFTGPHINAHLVELADWEGLPSNTFFHNNLVYAEGKLTFCFGGSTKNHFTHNAYYGGIVDPPADSNSVTADPQLTKPGAGGNLGDTNRLQTLDAYRLRSSSPLIDKGLDLRKELGWDVGARDYFGNALPAGAGPDIGAHEYAP